MAQVDTTQDRFWREGQREVIVWSLDAAANDSDKTFTVPSGKVWIPRLVTLEYTTAAGTGTRQPTLRILEDGASDIVYSSQGDDIIGDLTDTVTATRVWYPNSPATAAGEESMPELALAAGWGIQVLDAAGIAATADDMVVHIVVEQYDVLSA